MLNCFFKSQGLMSHSKFKPPLSQSILLVCVCVRAWFVTQNQLESQCKSAHWPKVSALVPTLFFVTVTHAQLFLLMSLDSGCGNSELWPLLNRLRFLNRLTERKWLQHNSVLLGIILPGIPFVITNWLERTSIVTLAPPKPSLTWMCFSCWSVVKNHFSLRSFNGIYSSLNDFSYESFHNR